MHHLLELFCTIAYFLRGIEKYTQCLLTVNLLLEHTYQHIQLVPGHYAKPHLVILKTV